MLHEDGSIGSFFSFVLLLLPFLPFFSYPLLHFYSKLLFVIVWPCFFSTCASTL